ncbi:hypothetical protein SAMN04487965_2967 [Microbulbifer donghaiensis]|uniref:Lipoprotein n=1 Tax=Microbulbifer donghaiensis TaxID=494016 RepID=A0A1M5FM37_9GAMM|nr:hypothetical protein [Microbulbifer donghaiensis]SHF92494.1 hypothetical protein SAMN04487965_2967 [Microbulbifer donghaiensis]
MRTFLAAMTLLLLVGCDRHTVLYYEFQTDLVETEYGELDAVISGEFSEASRFPRITHFGNPYTLLISFSPSSEEHTPLAISDITIRAIDGTTLYSFPGGEMETTWPDYNEDWYSSWTQQDLQLDHKILQLDFQLTFSVDGKVLKKDFSFSFKPTYEESHHSSQ